MPDQSSKTQAENAHATKTRSRSQASFILISEKYGMAGNEAPQTIKFLMGINMQYSSLLTQDYCDRMTD